MSSERIYLVSVNAANPMVGDNKLVRAANQAQAIRHVARGIIKAKVASQNDLVTLVGHGVAVETASAEPETAEA